MRNLSSDFRPPISVVLKLCGSMALKLCGSEDPELFLKGGESRTGHFDDLVVPNRCQKVIDHL